MATSLSDLDSYVQTKIATGQFSSREEFVEEALRLYRELEARQAALRSDIAAAIDEADRGLIEPFDIEAIKAELNAEFDAHGTK